MVCGAASFATMSTLVAWAGESCPWQVIAIVRTFLAMVFAASLARISGAQFVFFRPPVLWMRSLAGSLALLSGFFSLTRLPTTEVLTLTNMFPIWVAFLSWPLLRLKPDPSVWVAVACGVAGVVLMQQPQIKVGDYLWLVALSSSFWSALALIGLHQLRHLDARAVVTHFSAVSLAACIAGWFLFPHPAEPWSWTPSLVAILLGVGVSATSGQILLTKAFAHGHPGKVSVVGLSQVGFGMLLEWLFRHRSFNALTVTGMVLVLAPTAWVLLHERRSARAVAAAAPEE